MVALTLKNLFQYLLSYFLAGLFDSKTTLKICCKSFLEYEDTKKIAGINYKLVRLVKKFRIVPTGKPEFFGVKSPVNLLSLLKY